MKRPDQGMLAGMWAFPEREVAGGSDKTEAAKSIASAMGAVPLREPRALEPVEHAFSHVLATYLPVVIPVRDEIEGEGRRWVDPLDPDDLALPVAQRKVLEQVREEIA